MRLLVDLDGVCADFYGHLLNLYNEEYNDNVSLNEIKGWSLTPILRKTKTRERARAFIRCPSFWSDMPVINGCVQTLKSLQDAGHEIIILSATPEDAPVAGTEKFKWVYKHLPFIPHRNVFLGTRKELVRGDLLFDDGPHNIKAFPGLTCVMDASYNQDVQGDYRVHNWQEFETLVKDLKT